MFHLKIVKKEVCCVAMIKKGGFIKESNYRKNEKCWKK